MRRNLPPSATTSKLFRPVFSTGPADVKDRCRQKLHSPALTGQGLRPCPALYRGSKTQYDITLVAGAIWIFITSGPPGSDPSIQSARLIPALSLHIGQT